MKYKRIIIAAILYFFLHNSYLIWIKLPGLWDLLIVAILVLGFLILTVVLNVQLFYLIKERFANRSRNVSTVILSLTLILSFLFPLGIMDESDFEGPDLAFAQYEGVANCTVSLKLKEENRFKLRSVCFGVDEYEGKYHIDGDTIILRYDGRSPYKISKEYGVIELDSTGSSKYKGRIMYYKGNSKTAPLPLAISKYEL